VAAGSASPEARTTVKATCSSSTKFGAPVAPSAASSAAVIPARQLWPASSLWASKPVWWPMPLDCDRAMLMAWAVACWSRPRSRAAPAAVAGTPHQVQVLMPCCTPRPGAPRTRREATSKATIELVTTSAPVEPWTSATLSRAGNVHTGELVSRFSARKKQSSISGVWAMVPLVNAADSRSVRNPPPATPACGSPPARRAWRIISSPNG